MIRFWIYLELEPLGFPDRLDIRDDVGIFDLSSGRVELPYTGGEEEWVWNMCVGQQSGIVSDL